MSEGKVGCSVISEIAFQHLLKYFVFLFHNIKPVLADKILGKRNFHILIYCDMIASLEYDEDVSNELRKCKSACGTVKTHFKR
jgi:hypothetical protein